MIILIKGKKILILKVIMMQVLMGLEVIAAMRGNQKGPSINDLFLKFKLLNSRHDYESPIIR